MLCPLTEIFKLLLSVEFTCKSEGKLGSPPQLSLQENPWFLLLKDHYALFLSPNPSLTHVFSYPFEHVAKVEKHAAA